MNSRIPLRRNLAKQLYQIIIIKTLAYVLIQLKMEFSCHRSTKLRLNNKLSFPFSSNQSLCFGEAETNQDPPFFLSFFYNLNSSRASIVSYLSPLIGQTHILWQTKIHFQSVLSPIFLKKSRYIINLQKETQSLHCFCFSLGGVTKIGFLQTRMNFLLYIQDCLFPTRVNRSVGQSQGKFH